MKEYKIFVGVYGYELVFGTVDKERGHINFEGYRKFSDNKMELYDRAESLVDCLDKEYISRKLYYYDCKPSDLLDCIVDNFEEELLYDRIWDIDEIELEDETIYFEFGFCGKVFKDGEIEIVNEKAFEILNDLYKNQGIKSIDNNYIENEGIEKLIEELEKTKTKTNEEHLFDLLKGGF